MMLSRLGLAAAAVSLVVGIACSGSDEPGISLPEDAGAGDGNGTGTTGDADDVVGAGSAADDAGEDGEGAEDAEAEEGEAFVVAQAVDQTLVVREAAQEGADELLTLSAADEVSGKIICLVSQQIGSWVGVRLPSGGLERTGWVAREDVTLSRHRFRIEVSLSEHSLTLFTGRSEAFTAPVGLGPDSPEAGEELFIKDLVKTPDPDSPYGEYAYGLSGSANDLDAFTTGNGVVAVHGTGDPSGLGEDVRYGSIAVGRDILLRMVDTIGLPLGTPVDVVE